MAAPANGNETSFTFIFPSRGTVFSSSLLLSFLFSLFNEPSSLESLFSFEGISLSSLIRETTST